MSFHNAGWFAYLRYDEKKDRPAITREMLWRVWGFARPYRWGVLKLLFTILVITMLSLISPLLFRDLIDNAIPEENVRRLVFLTIGMVAIPMINGIVGVWQRNLNSQIGEGIIYDLRRTLYAHMQSMSLRFFTKTRTGELMSRMNNDVIGAQRAVSDTTVTIVSNSISVVATLTIMMIIDWRLTLLGVSVLPLFVLPARRIGKILRSLRRESMVHNAEMNATMNETLNISGALLVKLFGREERELDRFSHDAAAVRAHWHSIGGYRAMVFHDVGGCQCGRNGRCFRCWRLYDHSRGVHHRHHRRFQCVFRPTVRPIDGTHQRPRRIRAKHGQLRARL